jgi:hypothetical protein
MVLVEFDGIASIAFSGIDTCDKRIEQYVDQFHKWIASDIPDVISQYHQDSIIIDFSIGKLSHLLILGIHLDLEIYKIYHVTLNITT